MYGVLGVIIWRFGGYCMAVYSVTIGISTRCGGENFLLLFVSVVNTYKYALTANANAICSCVSFPLRVYLSRVEDVPVTEQVGHGSRRPTLRTDGHQQARRWACTATPENTNNADTLHVRTRGRPRRMANICYCLNGRETVPLRCNPYDDTRHVCRGGRTVASCSPFLSSGGGPSPVPERWADATRARRGPRGTGGLSISGRYTAITTPPVALETYPKFQKLFDTGAATS